jgi:predicted nucleic acid-binding protein
VIFVDTSVWYARYTPRDPNHQAARAFHLNNREPFVTTDYMIDESLTLFKARGNYDRALQFGPRVFSGKVAKIIWIEPEDVEAASNIFKRFRDKEWSSTDCDSYVVIQRLGIQRAFAYDEHFRQFGLVEVFG